MSQKPNLLVACVGGSAFLFQVANLSLFLLLLSFTIKLFIMNDEDLKTINLSILSRSFKLQAFQKCLNPDQIKIFETSLKESEVLFENKLAKYYTPSQVSAFLATLVVD